MWLNLFSDGSGPTLPATIWIPKAIRGTQPRSSLNFMNKKIRYRVLQAIVMLIRSEHYVFHRNQFHIDGMTRSILFSSNYIHTSYNNTNSSRILRIFRNSLALCRSTLAKAEQKALNSKPEQIRDRQITQNC
jgi:hypothetical protein